VGAPLVWGVAFANLVQGVPLDSDHAYAGTFLDLFTPYTVAAGLAVVAMFAVHGAMYLTLRVDGGLRERAAAAARRLSVPAALLGVGIVAWTVAVARDSNAKELFPTALVAGLTAVALVAAVVATRTRHGGWAFAATGLGAIGFVATIFTGLYPRVIVSDPVFANSLTISNAASGQYALEVITVVAAIFTPLVLLYQGWTYHVFRKRLSG
jgi:cytochrome d ubiquinol oxidase subunit II